MMSLLRTTTGKMFNIGLTVLIGLSLASIAEAQLSYRSGQHIEPAYEGWRENASGEIELIFGYFNENWEAKQDILVDENNYFSPGEPDRGQPTHFLPRRNRFTFIVIAPDDFDEDDEITWTITSPNGISKRAYATLRADYKIDDIIIASETGSLGAGTSSPESRSNVAPSVEILGDQRRTIRVGESLGFRTRVTDDGIPKPGRVGSRGIFAPESPEEYREQLLRPPRRTTVGKINGLYLSWNKYRGPGAVSFDPPQVKAWEDTRTSANSPWGPIWNPPEIPEDGIYEVTATFEEPGTYILLGRADDGGLYQDQYLTVEVTE